MTELRRRFENELCRHGQMHLTWLTDNVCYFYDEYDKTDRGICVLNDYTHCITLYNADNIDEHRTINITKYEHEEDDACDYIVVEGLHTDNFDYVKLHDQCINFCVIMRKVDETIVLEGLADNILSVLTVSGFSEDMAKEIISKASTRHETIIRFLSAIEAMTDARLLDNADETLYVDKHMTIWHDKDGLFRINNDIETYDKQQIMDKVLEHMKERSNQ